MSLLETITSLLNQAMKLFGGRDAEIARAKGEIPAVTIRQGQP
jgi:hypothetical protein